EDISGVAAGTYTVTVTDANGCTASTSITLTEPPVLTIISGTTDADICYGLSSDVFASPNGGTGVLVISWNQGLPDGSPNTVSPTTTTVYTATVTDENGCTASASTTIIVFDLPIPIVANNGPACEGFSITLTANGGVGYSWIGPNGFASNMQNPVLNNVDVSHGGIYTVTVTSSDGCTASTTMNVVVNPLPAPNFTAVNLIGCSPVCTEFSDLSTISAGSVTGWEWSANGTIFSNQQNPTQCFETPGIYDIFMTAMSDQGCTASFIINDLITVFANPVANFSSYPEVITSEDPTVYFTNNSTANAVTWSWNFGDGAFSDLENPKHMYADTGEFCITLTVTTVNNCPSTVINCIYIYPEYQIYIPNSFTPNGDKINDFFSVGGMGYVSLEMEIFDRWGESIYFTDNNIGWPGTIGSSDIIAKQDVYVYKIWVTSNLGEKFEYYGHINLLR
ncbi:MAG: gliding motility-associated C-terminal domain-containing protein, partial [Flavobacteriales bacterium]|nr:gliding motility-associated C-terminal domain-containing protein [Flavobacteriales bacterium]